MRSSVSPGGFNSADDRVLCNGKKVILNVPGPYSCTEVNLDLR
jgi:hypothetical protein